MAVLPERKKPNNTEYFLLYSSAKPPVISSNKNIVALFAAYMIEI